MSFAAQWLAYALPYRRFAHALADTNARLGVSVVRYSFTAEDLHLILLAGLPAHAKRYAGNEWEGILNIFSNSCLQRI